MINGRQHDAMRTPNERHREALAGEQGVLQQRQGTIPFTPKPEPAQQ